MGSCCSTKNVSTAVVKGNRISEIRLNVIAVQRSPAKNRTNPGEIKSKMSAIQNTPSTLHVKRNYFYVVQRKTWMIILDFLPYKDLCQARKLNKFLNKAAKNQFLLQKFYKNKRKSFSDNKQEAAITYINNNQNISNHFNYTTINNFSGELLPVDVQKYLSNLSINTKGIVKENSKENTSNTSNNSSREASSVKLKELKEVPTFNENKEFGTGIISNISNTFGFGDCKESSIISGRIRKFSATSEECKDTNNNNMVCKNTNNNPYIDIFSKKEVEFALNNKQTSANNSFEYVQSYRSSVLSVDHTHRTPSFSGEILLTQSEEGGVEIISIRNFTINTTRQNNMQNNNTIINTNKLNAGANVALNKKIHSGQLPQVKNQP